MSIPVTTRSIVQGDDELIVLDFKDNADNLFIDPSVEHQDIVVEVKLFPYTKELRRFTFSENTIFNYNGYMAFKLFRDFTRKIWYYVKAFVKIKNNDVETTQYIIELNPDLEESNTTDPNPTPEPTPDTPWKNPVYIESYIIQNDTPVVQEDSFSGTYEQATYVRNIGREVGNDIPPKRIKIFTPTDIILSRVEVDNETFGFADITYADNGEITKNSIPYTEYVFTGSAINKIASYRLTFSYVSN